MSKKETSDNTDWLEDAFNDDKNEELMLRAQKANNRSCLLALVVAIVVIVLCLIMGVFVGQMVFAI